LLRKKKEVIGVDASALPERWKILGVSKSGKLATVEMPINDVDKIRVVKLPAKLRDYYREKMREYREKNNYKGGRC
jgi:hypothetical protein